MIKYKITGSGTEIRLYQRHFFFFWKFLHRFYMMENAINHLKFIARKEKEELPVRYYHHDGTQVPPYNL